jgi:hypothetical protein
MEICECREVCEFVFTTRPNSFADGFVELNDAKVEIGMMLGEHL